jgi:hypothetical protein
MADNAMLLETGPRGPGLGGKIRDGAGGWRERLAGLFPEAIMPARRPRRPAVHAAVQVAVVCLGAGALLLRYAGIPAWDGTYAEDNGVFLDDALIRPWHLMVPYSGYLEFGPRVIGQFIASFLPLADASVAYAAIGALIGAASALFIYHASEGYIRSGWARALLGAALVLLPIAPLDIADSAVDSPWYTMAGLFFAVLWRPRSAFGMLAAALIAFYTTSSEIVALLFAPLLLLRVLALPRVREHAVTVGWLLGLLLQVPVVRLSYHLHKQRLGTLSTPGQAVAFYCHNVVLRAFGWHLSVWLKSVAGYNGATVIMGALLAGAIGWVLVNGGSRARLFAAVALLTGFAQTVFEATVSQYVNYQQPTSSFMAAARYSTLPVLLIAAIAIAGVDAYARRRNLPASATEAFWHAGPPELPTDSESATDPEPTGPPELAAAPRLTVAAMGPSAETGTGAFAGTDTALRSEDSRHFSPFARAAFAWPNVASGRSAPRPLVAVTVLVGVLAVGWVTDFSYVTQRAHDGYWRPYAQALVNACHQHPSGQVVLDTWGGHPVKVPCTRIRGLRARPRTPRLGKLFAVFVA